MSLDKAIKHKKEKRKPYRKSKAFSMSCRNHRGCDYCRLNRLYQTRKAKEAAMCDLETYLDELELGEQKYVRIL